MAGSLSLRSLFDGSSIKAAPARLGELFEFTARDGPESQFASWLPYVAYAPAEKIFVNRDTLGFMVELMPQSGADERMVEILLSLYATCPKGTGIQFSLFASPQVIEPLRRYGNLRVEDADHADKARDRGRPARNSNLYRTLARRRVGHYLSGSHVSLTQGLSLHGARLQAGDERYGPRRPRRPVAAGGIDHAARGDDLDLALGQFSESPVQCRRPHQLVCSAHKSAPADGRSHPGVAL